MRNFSNEIWNTRIKYSVYLNGGLFLVLYFILSFHSRLASDDFFYIGLENEYGAWNGMLYQYDNWSGRWAAHFAACGLLQFRNYFLFLPLINVFTLYTLSVSIKLLFEKILKYLGISVSKIELAAISLLFVTAFFFLSFSIGESWFWYIIIITYLWSLIGFLIILNSIYSEKNKFKNILLLIFSSAFIGGASESFALIFLFILSILFLYSLKINSTLDLKIRIISAFALILISFAFAFFAPGTEIRHSLLPHTPFPEKILIAGKSYAKYFIYYLPSKLPYIFLFSSPWCIFGNYFLRNKLGANDIKKFIKIITAIFLVCTGIFYLPTSYVMSETGPDRALLIISFITTIYFSILFCCIRTRADFNKKSLRITLTSLSIFTTLVLIYHIFNEYTITKQFSVTYDERMTIIQKAIAENRSGALELEALPKQGKLYWEELSSDTSYFTNKHLKYGLNLPFSVKLK